MNKRNRNRPIGIIGGMGPDASARLYSQMIEMARNEFGVKTNVDYPEIMLQSIPIPEFISDFNQSNKAYLMIKDRINKLAKQDLSCLGIACNTAHMFLDKLKKEARVKYVSILEEVLIEVKERGYDRVGLLASPATYYLDLYQKEFDGSGVELVIPKKKEIQVLGRIVEKIVLGRVNSAGKKLKIIADN
ncbi:MAG: aspartate/glutamate racemase family protein, partial [Candidatus Beckwithbacteria bacterium]|nr:aspartate/glutamate racemase family protein [Patescibacteria group bacterium]